MPCLSNPSVRSGAKKRVKDTLGIHSVTLRERLWSAVPVVSQCLWSELVSVSACSQSVPVVSQCL